LIGSDLLMHELPSARVWLIDFDNTLAALEPEVDWAASRVELERFLRSAGVADTIFREIPRGNLPLYEKLRARLTASTAKDSRSPDLVPVDCDHTALLTAASAIIESYELRGSARARECSGTTTLLSVLRERRCRIAIVTSNSSRTVRDWLAREGLAERIDAIVGRDTLLPLKPAPDMVLRALTEVDSAPHDAVMVGDSTADAEAAKAARVRFCGIASSIEKRTQLAAGGASAVFSSPADLTAKLLAG
jgi:phosphoglycolate phosphatase-like HAD superfamily hydrolase